MKINKRNAPRDNKGAEETLTFECPLTRCIIRRKLIKWLTTRDKKVLSDFEIALSEKDQRRDWCARVYVGAGETNREVNASRSAVSQKRYVQEIKGSSLDKIILSCADQIDWIVENPYVCALINRLKERKLSYSRPVYFSFCHKYYLLNFYKILQ